MKEKKVAFEITNNILEGVELGVADTSRAFFNLKKGYRMIMGEGSRVAIGAAKVLIDRVHIKGPHVR